MKSPLRCKTRSHTINIKKASRYASESVRSAEKREKQKSASPVDRLIHAATATLPLLRFRLQGCSDEMCYVCRENRKVLCELERALSGVQQ